MSLPAATPDDDTRRTGRRIVATLTGGALLLVSLADRLFHTHAFHAQWVAALAAGVLGAPLVVAALRAQAGPMQELVALAFAAAFAAGEYTTAGSIAFFMTIANLVETRTAQGARKSIESLIRITPTRATLLVASGEREVEAKDLAPGDRIRVRAGDNVPADGKVLTGASTVDQATITGESLPVSVQPGDQVFGGTINLTGVLEVEITKAGRDTTLGQVQQLILQAERSRTPILRMIDRYAGWYTPTVLMLACVALFFTRDVTGIVAFLVVACPSAVVLSAPTAIVAALSAASRLGVLIKNVTDLEVARSLTAVVFDKTGTLTTGQLQVVALRPAEGVSGEDLLRSAATPSQGSRHPVAKAILAVARQAHLECESADGFEEVPGKGVLARAPSGVLRVGRASWLADLGVDATGLDVGDAAGLSLLHVARDGRMLGVVKLADRTRPDAARALAELEALKIHQRVMLTGDREDVARRVASEMRCTDFKAEVLPHQKLEMVAALKARGHTVAVVGDGVNDAPALAAGDISIAMGVAGSDVAIHSASIALMSSKLDRIPFLIRLSRAVTSVVRQNLTFSAAFIVAFGTASLAGYVHPIAAAALHVASSLFVIFNSARLIRQGEELEVEARPGIDSSPDARAVHAPAPVRSAPAGA